MKQKVITAVFHRDGNPLIDSYSASFDNGRRQKTALDDWLCAHVINELIAMDLATDYCVKLTVLNALQSGCKMNVIIDDCRGVNIQPRDSAHTFMEMLTAGVTLYTSVD